MLLLLSVMMLPVNSNATTHLWFWVNGENSNMLTQGDNFAWELDLSSVGGSVAVEIYLDLNASRTIDAGDFYFDTITITDGEQEDGPSDSSAVPDGNIYLQFGPFGFAAQNYIMRATDQDESTVTNWFQVNPMADPPATVSGTITIEGTDKPDSKYENVMIAAMGENGIWSGLTDDNGDYVINLPVADAQWQIGTIFDNTLPEYTKDPNGYELSIPAGNTGSINFTFILPSSYVHGSIFDQNEALIICDGYISLSNETTGGQTESVVRGGHFTIPAQVVIQGSDSTNTFIIRTDDKMLIPDYLSPADMQFELKWGDSLEYNLVAYQTNATIYGYVTEDGENPSKTYQFAAWSELFGQTMTESDPSTGYFELSVREGSTYNIWLQDDPQWGTPPPPGYVIEQNWQMATPGETVYFNLVPANAAIRGTITFDPGDPTNLDHERSRVSAWESTSSSTYSSTIDESNNFFIPVIDGNYDVTFNEDNNQYLAMPSHYPFISVEADTVDTLEFELNYAHAVITVKLRGDVPFDQGGEFYGINSFGEWPWVYQTGAELQADSTYQLKVCEGQWYLQPPIWVNPQEYSLIPSDTTLTVTEVDSIYYVEFTYKLLSGIAENQASPTGFYLKQNYPNPFNPSTTISYGLMKTGQVKLDIYNILGEKVASLVDGVQKSGNYQLEWNPQNLASGVYLYRLEAGDFVQTRKLMLIR